MARPRRSTTWAMMIGSALAVWSMIAGPLAAQASSAPHGPASQKKDPDVPVAYRPPPGMCRVWLAGVPATQQPAPTDCPSAVRNRPSNGRVLFGDDYAKKSSSTRRPDATLLASTAARPEAPGTWRFIAARDVRATDTPTSGGLTRRMFVETVVTPGALTGPAIAADSDPVPAARVDKTRPLRAPAQDEYEAGYAAGYRDAMNGRRPRFRGADRTDPGTNATGPAPRGGRRGSTTEADYPPLGYGQPGYGQPGYGQLGYGQPGGALVVVPPGQDPRYFNNGRYPPPGRANGICLDRDGDGWCDDPRYGGANCRDLDGDGRCDDYPMLAGAPFPSSLPDMHAGLDVQQGRGSAVALRWLGTSEVVARLVNPQRNATPYRVLWFDANTNTLLQSWTDLDGDGIADRVEIFRNGRRVKLLGR